MFITNDRSFSINKVFRNRRNHRFIFKDTMQTNNFHTFVNEWKFDQMACMVDLRIDIRTKKMLKNLLASSSKLMKQK